MQRFPLSLAFFLSGVAGISYELVWVRYVGRVVGGSTPAVAATVAFFLGGLALGAALLGKRFDRARRPLLAYALLEALIGATAAIVPTALLWVERSLPPTAPISLSLLACCAVLLPATTLLGATFPAMARAIEALFGPIEGTARFYGLNTLGGMLGALVAAFALVPTFGYATTNRLMISCNILAALLLVFLHRRWPSRTEAPKSGGPSATSRPGLPYRAALSIAALTGFFSIAIEVLWVRGLALCFPGTVYVFSVVLAAYLAGIGAGSLALLPLSRRTGALTLLPLLYLFTALGVLGSALLLPGLTDLFFALVQSGSISSWKLYISGVGLSVLLAMLPATLAMGAALPLLIGLASRAGRGHDAGQIYAANIVGGVAGSLTTTFSLMPALGLSRTLTLGAVGYLLVAAFLIRLTSVRRGLKRGLPWGAAALGVGALLGLHPEMSPSQPAANERRQLFHRDAPSGTIAIYERGKGTRAVRSLEVNNFYGLNETHPHTVAMQYRLGHIPLLAHGRPRSALLLGFATGSTLAAMASHPLDRLDCVEIHADLLALAHFFASANQRVFESPKVRLFAADGRRFVAATKGRYDVIVSDLFLPRNPGVGALYSIEHFRATRARLEENGLFVVWLPLWQLSTWEVGVITRTFLEVFPHARGRIGNPSPGRPALGLFSRPTTGDQPQRMAQLLSSHLRRSMQRAFGALAPPTLESAIPIVDSETLEGVARGKGLNTLDFPIIEFSAPRTLIKEQIARKEGGLAATNLRRLTRRNPLR